MTNGLTEYPHIEPIKLVAVDALCPINDHRAFGPKCSINGEQALATIGAGVFTAD